MECTVLLLLYSIVMIRFLLSFQIANYLEALLGSTLYTMLPLGRPAKEEVLVAFLNIVYPFISHRNIR